MMFEYSPFGERDETYLALIEAASRLANTLLF